MNGITLRGWRCQCGIFNGEEKDKRDECRTCGREKGVQVDTLEDVIKHFDERHAMCHKTATLTPDMGVKVSSSARAETYLYVNFVLHKLLQKQAVDALTEESQKLGLYEPARTT